MEKNKILFIVLIVLVIIVILTVLTSCNANSKKRAKIAEETSKSLIGEIKKPLEERFCAPVKEKKKKTIKCPVLRCYDTFVFPNEGTFHVKTCSGPKPQERKGSKIFLQWFPVEKASKYRVYASTGNEVTPIDYLKTWDISAKEYTFESELLEGGNCWSAMVTAIDKHGNESESSKVYTTC